MYNHTQAKVGGSADPQHGKTCPGCKAGAIFNSHGTPGRCLQPGCIDFSVDSDANRIDNVFNFILDVYMNTVWDPKGNEYANAVYPGVKLALGWLMSRSAAYGVPQGCLNTNDEHGVMGDVGIYNSICYVSALVAGQELAKIYGDNETAAEAAEAQVKGLAAIQKLLWQPEGGFFTSFWCSKIPEFEKRNHMLQSSVLYGANWAWLLGLGAKLHLDNSSIASHLQQEFKRNFNERGGVIFASNRSVAYNCGELKPDPDFQHPGHFTDEEMEIDR